MTRDELATVFEPPLAPYSPELRKLALDAAWSLSQRFHPADALVYDNYNFVVCGWTLTGKPGDAFISIAVAPKHMSICFLKGVHLSDPEKRLRGGGKLVRNLSPDDLELLQDPYVSRLIDDAVAMAKRGDCTGSVKLQSTSEKKRRPKSAAK